MINVDSYLCIMEYALHLTHLCTMMKWLATLPCHNYEVLPPGSEREPSAILEACRLLKDKSTPTTSQQVHSDSDCVVDVRDILRTIHSNHASMLIRSGKKFPFDLFYLLWYLFSVGLLYCIGLVFTMRPMLCMVYTMALCLSQVSVLLKLLNVGLRKQHHMIAQGL